MLIQGLQSEYWQCKTNVGWWYTYRTYQGCMDKVCVVFRDQLQRSDTRHLEGQKSLQLLKAEFDNLSTIVPRCSSLASSSSPLGSGNHAPGLRCCMLLLHGFSFHLHWAMSTLQGCRLTSTFVDICVDGLHVATMCSSSRHMLR